MLCKILCGFQDVSEWHLLKRGRAGIGLNCSDFRNVRLGRVLGGFFRPIRLTRRRLHPVSPPHPPYRVKVDVVMFSDFRFEANRIL